MSTSELFLEADEVEDFIRETLSSDSLYTIGDEGRDIGLCPFASFYIYNKPDQFLQRSAAQRSAQPFWVGHVAELIALAFERVT